MYRKLRDNNDGRSIDWNPFSPLHGARLAGILYVFRFEDVPQAILDLRTVIHPRMPYVNLGLVSRLILWHLIFNK